MKIFKLAVLAAMTLIGNTSYAAALSESVNGFSRAYFATLNHDENIFYSPYSIAAALSLVANGATGDTQREILSALHADSLENLNAEFKNFRSTIAENYSGTNILRDANLILVNKNFIGNGVNPSFKNSARNIYGAEIRAADFAGNLNGEKKKIAVWIDKKTNHFLPNYQSSANSATVVDLLNVVYFKGTWNFPFDAESTADKNFTNRDGSTASVKMMRKTFDHEISYAENDSFKGIEIPYKNSAAAMYVILPKSDSNLKIADKLDAENFIAQIAAAPKFNGEVSVWLPKFELDIKNNLVDDLKAIGIERAFSNDAEFFNLVQNVQLKIDSATHQAKIRVDESGTEAAAVTEFTFETTAMPPQYRKFVEFHADRPFFFVIRDVESGVNLFTGVVNHLD